MGPADPLPVDEAVEYRPATRGHPGRTNSLGTRYTLAVLLAAIAIYFGCIVSPPSLMDDVDAVQAQIARNMLESGDWITARLDGVPYLEKSPLIYWLIAVSFAAFGVHDWAARIPVALASVLLAWITARFGAWAFGARAGKCAGLSVATCVGLFLFTRIQIPDVVLTLCVTLGLWGFLRALEPEEQRRTFWAMILWSSMALGLLLKGLIAVLFPVATALIYLIVRKELLRRETWRALQPWLGLPLLLLIAAPWHVLATLSNPPFLDFTLHSEAGSYRGFFWFYFINEHVLRFLNLRYPRDYNTVPRLYFWLFHLLWLFPWSVYLPAALRTPHSGDDRAARARLLAWIWISFILVFFTFSTTQEYYSMPCYPALALLLGAALAGNEKLVHYGTRAVAVAATAALCAVLLLLFLVRGTPAPGDISAALTQNPEAYTLSLGHMGDLTLRSFAYLRMPLALAAIAFAIGAVGTWFFRNRAVWALAAMMVVFFHAARLALVAFDPYLGSRVLAEALLHAPEGNLIVDDQYYAFSSIFFYTGRRALLLNGRVMNLEYGSYAPGTPNVFIKDDDFARLWSSHDRYYLVAAGPAMPRLKNLVGEAALKVVRESGGKFLLVNR